MTDPELTKDIIIAALGETDDLVVTRILETGASVEAFEEAVAWAADEGEPLGKDRHPLVGAAAEVYDILTAEKELEVEEPRPS